MATVTVVKNRTTVESGAKGKTWIGGTLVQRIIEIEGGSITFGDGRVEKFGPGTMRMTSHG